MLGRKVSNKNVITNDHDDDYDELLSSIEHFYEIQNAAHHGRDNARLQAYAREASTRPVKLFRNLTSFLRRAIPQDGLPEPRRAKAWPLVNFVIRTYTNLALTFLFDGKMLIFSPVNALLFLTVYPFMIVLLITVELTLKVFLDYLGGQALVTYLSVRYGGATPHLFHGPGVEDLMLSTIPTFGERTSDTITNDSTHVRYFDISKAEVLTLLSALIYERDANKVKDAYQLYATSDDQKDDAQKLDESDNTDMEDRTRRLLWESEKRIRQIARRWGLHFAGVSELKSLGGPFCGMFWSTEHNCIIVTLKGTTVDNYEEIMLDAAIQRTDARAFLFGACHQGFYESVFPSSGSFESDTRDPYGTILTALHERAKKIQDHRKSKDPVNVWVTGHSLGSAMSCLIFARWLRCPDDLDSKICILRDAYTIGTPGVGDNDFAAGFASYTNTPYSRTSTLWRIVNQSDIVARLPIGTDNPVIGRYFSRNDFFNYSHIGQAIQILSKWHEKPVKIYPSTYQPSLKVQVVLGAYNNSSSTNDIHGQEPFSQNEESYTVSSPTSTESTLDSPSGSQFLQLTKLRRQSTGDKQIFDSYKPIPMILQRLDENGWFNKLDKWMKGSNPIQCIEGVYPFWFMDHIPHCYYSSLQRLRQYYEQHPSSTVATPQKTSEKPSQ
ncbi:hypothetical protein NQZ79_g5517 [Umbelopsis isabellina]|nr:hypothetical protein NQZ79_g5517 [Umbelopsis isabellina]